MTTFNVPNSIVAGEDATAAPLQANFDYIEGALNDSVIHVDGSKPFTALPVAPSDLVPSSQGHLVTKKVLDDRTQLVFHKEFTAAQTQYAFGNTWRWLGVSSDNFTFPAIGTGQVFTIQAHVPLLQIAEKNMGGSAPYWPTVGAAMDVALFFKDDEQRLTLKRVNAGDLSGFQPDGTPSLDLIYHFYDNTRFAAGSTQRLNLRGRIPLGDGQFNLVGNATYPIQLIGKMG